MTYQEYSTYMKICDYLGKEPKGTYKYMYDFLSELWDDVEVVIVQDRGAYCITFYKGESVYFIYDTKRKHLRICPKPWSKVKHCLNEIRIDSKEALNFINNVVEDYIKYTFRSYNYTFYSEDILSLVKKVEPIKIEL
jgi:hypothetical protein